MNSDEALKDYGSRLPYVKLEVGQTIEGTFADDMQPETKTGSNGDYIVYNTQFTPRGADYSKEWGISGSLLKELKTRATIRKIDFARCIFSITRQDKKNQPYIVDIIGEELF